MGQCACMYSTFACAVVYVCVSDNTSLCRSLGNSLHHNLQQEGALRDANKSLKNKLTWLPERGIDWATFCHLIGTWTVLHNKRLTPPHNWMES